MDCSATTEELKGADGMTDGYEEILTFWLGETPDNHETVREKSSIWFAGNRNLDREIRTRFLARLIECMHGELADWQELPRGRLASIILLDQFSRNIHRGSAEAFSQDQLAQELVLRGLKDGDESSLGIVERCFYYLPLHHSERIERQSTVVELFAALLDETPAELRRTVKGFHRGAIEHRDVIERFGRFPHRNQVLRRESTPDEVEYLQAGGKRYGQ
jgi:uncharacterized protein (DUF924 family)|tara:strand:+ start:2866 stop:3519 length:654 start_codon:yes stop_codon:yes gene_type:complete